MTGCLFLVQNWTNKASSLEMAFKSCICLIQLNAVRLTASFATYFINNSIYCRGTQYQGGFTPWQCCVWCNSNVSFSKHNVLYFRPWLLQLSLQLTTSLFGSDQQALYSGLANQAISSRCKWEEPKRKYAGMQGTIRSNIVI